MDLDTLLQLDGGIIRTREHRSLGRVLSRAVAEGLLARPLPGVVCHPQLLTTTPGLLAIAASWRPDAVVVGRAAAHLWWPNEFSSDHVDLLGPRTTSHGPFRVTRGRVPPEHVRVRNGFLVTDPDLTVLDELSRGRRDVLHTALRSRFVTLPSLASVLGETPGRPGNGQVRRELRRARENPWSQGEDQLHAMLRAHRFVGWHGNVRVMTSDGTVYYLDVGFPRAGLALEFDGLAHHTSRADREYDYARRAALMALGWRVMGITTLMLSEPRQPGTAAAIRAALGIVRAERRRPWTSAPDRTPVAPAWSP